MDVLEVLLPHLIELRLDRLHLVDSVVHVEAATKTPTASCPACGVEAGRVHGRYTRSLLDIAAAGRQVQLRLLVRRFFCDNRDCPNKTFAEQVPGLTARFGRKTLQAGLLLQAVALALGGRPAARLAGRLAVPAGRMTMLRLIRCIPDPPIDTPEVLGVDDFAIKKGQHYATILVDMATHRPIDVLAGREADTFAQWLREHPGVQVICRDRGGAYAEGGRAGAPDAIQVADRFHLWANLGEAVEKTVLAHHNCIKDAFAPPTQPSPPPPDTSSVQAPGVEGEMVTIDEPDGTLDSYGRPRRLVARTTERYHAVQALLADGHTLTEIKQRLGLDHGTVRRFARATSLEELLAKATNRASTLDRYKPLILAWCRQGITNASDVFLQLQAEGYRGSVLTVRRYVHQLRPQLPATPGPARPSASKTKAPPAPPKPRQVTRWIMTRPDRLRVEDTTDLEQVLSRCPELERAAQHVAAFADMMSHKRGDRLDEWMAAVQADPLPALHSFVTGVRRDKPAVVAGLSLPWSSGAVEGAVTRAKAIKRAFYGRANLDLLRKRILIWS